MGATLKDVANLAEVSTATVSYVLNNGPRPVSSATRNKVLDAIDQLGYQPRRKRRANTSPHTLTIGVIVPNANATFFGDALDGIEAFLCSHGHNCLVASSRSDLAIERRAIRQMAKLVDGFIITPSASLHPDILRLSDSGTTIVLMDRQVNASAFSGVGIDN
jgi:LacI family transcriptional regulator